MARRPPEEIRFCAINDQVSEVAYAIPEIPSHTLADPKSGIFDERNGQAARSLMEAVCAVVGIDMAKRLGVVLS